MGRLNDIVNGDGELTNKETAEILKILLANYYLVRMWKINPDEGTIYTLAINKAIKALEHAENNETESVYDMAHEIGDPYYADSPLIQMTRQYGQDISEKLITAEENSAIFRRGYSEGYEAGIEKGHALIEKARMEEHIWR